MSKYFLLTFGCPKNEVVSEELATRLLPYGLKQTIEIETAEFVLINTCGFISSAIEENMRSVQELTDQTKKIIIYGCIPQRFQLTELSKTYPQLKKISYWAPNFLELEKYLEQTLKYSLGKNQRQTSRLNSFSSYAYVAVADGCSMNCTYCTIPGFKGKYVSKEPEVILTEIAELINYGVKEIVLIAQETTFYGLDLKLKTNLAQLLDLICETYPTLPRIRIMYAHPNGITDELIETIAKYQQICPYIDLPLQHANDKILKSMNRNYDNKKVRQLITKLRRKILKISLRSTFIVGFPSETEAQFEELLAFIEEVKLDYAGFFAYEPESNTKAKTLPDQVPDEVKQERLKQIYALQEDISADKLHQLIGEKVEILTEFIDGQYTFGRTIYQAPEIDGYVKVRGKHESGEKLRVKITEVEYPNLVGKILP